MGDADNKRQKFCIEFHIQQMPNWPFVVKKVEIDTNKRPSSETGVTGSILDIALASGIDIDHACGGFCACSTCHIVVKEGLDSCCEIKEAEEDQLDKAPGLTPQSRLACQTVPSGAKDLVIEVPNWNRNLVKEGK